MRGEQSSGKEGESGEAGRVQAGGAWPLIYRTGPASPTTQGTPRQGPQGHG